VAWEEARQASQVRELAPQEAIKDRELTYLELPPSLKQEPPKSGTDIISDENRRATTRDPIHIEKPREIISSATAPGAPGPLAMPAIKQPPAPGNKGSSEAAQGTPMPQLPTKSGKDASESPLAKLEAPDIGSSGKPGSNWSGALSAGSVIQQATKAAAESRARGAAGDFGEIPDLQPNAARGDLEMLSDTLGVDFAPYMQRLNRPIKINWSNAMPESVNAPLRKSGLVILDFVVSRSGKVEGLRMVHSSGDVALDRAAWAAITASNPFPQLPPNFRADSFAFRVRFYYNPDRAAQLR
jgi:TonB family protein